jgi:hypothetical protein
MPFQIKKYLVNQGYGQYCSRKCQHSDYPQQVNIICKQCGVKFFKPPSQAKLSIYCSKACHDAAMSDFETRICAQCHKEFQIPTWETKKGKGKFCSRECFIKFNGEDHLEEKVRKHLKAAYRVSAGSKFGRY